ncbi:MAG: SDR family oxidoreductase [Ferrovibrionaceae bacterium]
MSEAEPLGYTDEALAGHRCSLAAGLLDGLTVMVSGGGSGIGRTTAWVAARLGAKVIVTGRTTEKLAAVAAGMAAHGLACDTAVVDIRKRETVEAMFDQVLDRHGRIDLLVNSAGGQFPQPAIDYSLKGWKAVIETNLDGTFHMMQCAAQRWRKAATGGSIVNVVVSPRGLHHVAHSVAARAGVIAFSEAVAVEWGPLGIRVNCVAPGAIRSEGWAVYQPHVRNRYANTNPLRTVGTPWDVAEAILYVGGPAGRFISGDTLQITGAGHLWGEVWTTDKPEPFVEATRAFDPAFNKPAE